VRVHDRDRRVRVFVFLHEKQGERFAHDHTAANNHDVRAVDVDLTFNQQSLDTEGGAWNKSAGITDYQLRHVLPVETIDIFVWVECADNRLFIYLLWCRRLHKNAVNAGIAIQFLDPSEQFSLGGRYRQLELHRMQTERATHLVFRAYIGPRGRVVANKDDSETRSGAFRF